jgi:predicted MPP superfamily phosphohydrolase
MILRVPINLKNYLNTIIERIIRQYLPKGFSLVISHQPDAIGYSTKYYSNIFRDEMFEVF